MKDWLTSKAYDDWKCNPPEPQESAIICVSCGQELIPGDPYWEIAGESYCQECASDWFDEQKLYVTED